jgi:hypothetical protein
MGKYYASIGDTEIMLKNQQALHELIKENQEARQAKASNVTTAPSFIDIQINSDSSKSTQTQALVDRLTRGNQEKEVPNK